MENHEAMLCMPSVFAVGDEYQIFSVFDCAALVRVRIGGREFCDDSNGVLRSNTKIRDVSAKIHPLLQNNYMLQLIIKESLD